jgi:hypothetical protein
LCTVDIQMPGSMDGLILARAIRAADQDHCDLGSCGCRGKGFAVRFLAKPCSPGELADVVHELTDTGRV